MNCINNGIKKEGKTCTLNNNCIYAKCIKWEFVKLHYGSPYTGIILDRIHRRKMGDLLLVLMVKDSSGNVPLKRFIRSIDEAWTKETEAFDISYINKDWFNTKTLNPDNFYHFKDRL